MPWDLVSAFWVVLVNSRTLEREWLGAVSASGCSLRFLFSNKLCMLQKESGALWK